MNAKRILYLLIIVLLYSSTLNAHECSCIVTIQKDSMDWNDIYKYIASNYKTNTLSIRVVTSYNEWSLAEVESKDFEPIIVLLKKSSDKFEVKAEWGGMVEEGDTAEVVSAYFAEEAPDAPPCLLKHYMPAGPPFLKQK